MENQHIKNFFPYVRNMHIMKKDELEKFLESLSTYAPDYYAINGKQIHPDDEQMAVINAHLDCHLRVLAGAGTGKTTTICCRIKKLIDQGIHPKNILMLTFNVEACANMKQRIENMFGFQIDMEIRTIDAFCRKLIYHYQALIENGGMISLAEYACMAKRIMDSHGHSLAQRYSHVFFDEFQDVSGDQFYILNSFAANGSKLCCIGDDSQNIYQFRGSDNRYIVNLDKILPNVKTYMIQTNYRSNQKIIEIANQSIKMNLERIDKQMKPYQDIQGICDLTFCDSGRNEAEHLINMIEKYTKKGIQYNEIAILGRSSRRLKAIETEFERVGLDYVSLFDDKYSREEKKQSQKDKISLSTIHSAKGLEWKIVFIVGLADWEFPSQMNNGIRNIEEERRLFYVGITRAKTHLHFVTSMTDIPVSRFVESVLNHLKINRFTSKLKNNVLIKDICEKPFANQNDNLEHYQRHYCATDLIDGISGSQIQELRELSLLPELNSVEVKYFNQQLNFTQQIKDNNFESDYGIFCDLYMTRDMMLKNRQKIHSVYCECVLNSLSMSPDEEKLWHQYNLCGYFKSNDPMAQKIIIGKIKNQDHSAMVQRLIQRLRNKVKNNISESFKDLSIDQYILMCITNFYYPGNFYKELVTAYEEYTDITKRSEDIMRSIYLVSLCQKFIVKRRRLVYRDISDMFEENNKTVIPRIDQWTQGMGDHTEICKINTAIDFMYDKKNNFQMIQEVSPRRSFSDDILKVVVSGEIDYVDTTDNTLVDIKCSSSDMKLEWLIQLLIYYSMLKITKQSIGINKLAILNVFRGIKYTFNIPEDYDHVGMCMFMGNQIRDSLRGVRKRFNIEVPVINNLHQVIELTQVIKDQYMDQRICDSEDQEETETQTQSEENSNETYDHSSDQEIYETETDNQSDDNQSNDNDDNQSNDNQSNDNQSNDNQSNDNQSNDNQSNDNDDPEIKVVIKHNLFCKK
jgi:hypothetical protein